MGAVHQFRKLISPSTADMSKSFATNVKKQESNHTLGPEAMSNSLNGQKATHIPIGYKRPPGLHRIGNLKCLQVTYNLSDSSAI